MYTDVHTHVHTQTPVLGALQGISLSTTPIFHKGPAWEERDGRRPGQITVA